MMDSGKNSGLGIQKPLEGVRILEYAIFYAGPGACAILSDLGADVIKIESRTGDPQRTWTRVGQFSFDLPHKRTLMFDCANRNKRGITLDIEQQKGREIFHQLLKESDVFLTNLRPSTKKRLGIEYETLSKINPRIIHANVSGYGPKGPFCDVGAYDPMGQARSGMMFATGAKEPTLMQIAVLDQSTAISASHAILSALFFRERSGLGQEVHVSLYSTALWLLYANTMLTSLMNIDASEAIDMIVFWDRPQNHPLRNTFCCKDGKWVIGVHHPPGRYWEAFCRATGQEALLNDCRFDEEAKQYENSAEAIAIFDKVFAAKTRDEWMEILSSHGLMFGSIQMPTEVLHDPQALENNYIVDFDHPDFGTVKIPGYPIHFSQGSVGTRSAAPTLGQHTDEVLQEMGYTTKEIEQLRLENII